MTAGLLFTLRQLCAWEEAAPLLAEEALAHFDRAVALKPDLAPAHWHASVALKTMGRLAEAEEATRRYRALAPDDVLAAVQMTSLLRDRGDAAGAASMLREAVALEPQSPIARSSQRRACMSAIPRFPRGSRWSDRRASARRRTCSAASLRPSAPSTAARLQACSGLESSSATARSRCARSFEIFLALSDYTAQRAGGRVIRERLEDGDEESVCFLDIARHDRAQTQRDHALCVCRIHRRSSSGDAT